MFTTKKVIVYWNGGYISASFFFVRRYLTALQQSFQEEPDAKLLDNY